jgi:hypothetical protein
MMGRGTLRAGEAVNGAPPAEWRGATLTASLRTLWHDLQGLVGDRVDLLSLELHRAGLAAAQILLWMVAASIFGVTAWLALCGGVAMLLLQQGLHWSGVLLLLMLANLGAAWIAFNRAKALAPRLALPVTRRHLRFGGDDDTAAPGAGDGAGHDR